MTELWNFEHEAMEKGYSLICGVDEAGRGPLAGPVCAAAVILPTDLDIPGLNDSKKLTEKKRDELYDIITAQAVAYGIAMVSEEEIDEINILQATFLAMKRAVESLAVKPDFVLIDGNREPDLGDLPLKSIVKGDSRSANIAAAEFPGKVFVVDSQTVTIGEGILAELALSLAESGMSASDIAERLCRERENIEIIALLDTLEYLKRGGRISKTAAIAGGLLSIKPVISVFDGEINVLGKARGSKQGNNLLVQQIESNGGIDFSKPLMLGYTGFSQARLQEYIDDSTALWKNGVSSLRCAQIGSTVGTHAGPGAIAAAFFKKS